MGAVSEKPPVVVAPKIPEQIKTAPPVEAEKKKLKICCACPETKQVRDECMVMNGEEDCKQLIEAHKACLRAAGFDIK